MKTITITIIAICLMNLTLAYYPGEVLELQNEMGIDNLVYTIIDNSTTVPNLNITINSTSITIEFPQDMPPNDFKIIFLEETTKEVVKVVHSGGGSSRTKYVDRNVTVNVPEYVETVKEVEVEKIIKSIECIEEEAVSDINHIIVLVLGILCGLAAMHTYHKNNQSKETKDLNNTK